MAASQSDFPDSWDKDCEAKHTKVEIGVTDPDIGTLEGDTFDTIRDIEDWIEIPVADIEHWETKGSDVSIKRSARVEHPTEWDGASVADVVSPEGVNATMRFGRVYHKDYDDNWVLKHCGYVWSAGNIDELASKFWIYDMADLLKAVPASKSFNNPTLADVVRWVSRTITEETTVPLDAVVVVDPNTELEHAVFYGDVDTDAPTSSNGYFALDDLGEGTAEGDVSLAEASIDTDGPLETVLDFGQEVGVGLAALGFVGTGVIAAAVDVASQGMGSKKFTPNRDTVYDVLSWAQDRVNTNWYFVPTDDGVALVFDVVPSRRHFAQAEVVEALRNGDIEESTVVDNLVTDLNEYRIHGTTLVEENDALQEINPINQTTVYGDTKLSELEDLSGDVLSLRWPESFSENGYPVVTARADPIFEAAGGVELEDEPIVSDAHTIDQAKNEAVTALQRRIATKTEGNIDVLGNPYISPWDTLDAFETCGDYVEDQPIPVRYEVAEVKHTESMGGLYRQELDVHVHVGDSQISFPVATTK